MADQSFGCFHGSIIYSSGGPVYFRLAFDFASCYFHVQLSLYTKTFYLNTRTHKVGRKHFYISFLWNLYLVKHEIDGLISASMRPCYRLGKITKLQPGFTCACLSSIGTFIDKLEGMHLQSDYSIQSECYIVFFVGHLGVSLASRHDSWHLRK